MSLCRAQGSFPTDRAWSVVNTRAQCMLWTSRTSLIRFAVTEKLIVNIELTFALKLWKTHTSCKPASIQRLRDGRSNYKDTTACLRNVGVIWISRNISAVSAIALDYACVMHAWLIFNVHEIFIRSPPVVMIKWMNFYKNQVNFY